MSSPDAPARPPSRLAAESSPYLLQHARNPVDWYPWGDEAFAKARADDKPILLSVGYATCHWCHVMERESFEDAAIGRQLAEGFVAIKVDREELPDVDQVYMAALQALGGQGGWPMNIFLTPQLKPFFGGTYFPPRPRHRLPSFGQLLAGVREAWLQRRAEIEQQATALLAHVAAGTTRPPRAPAPDAVSRAVDQFARHFDAEHGGFGSAPKFPQSPLLLLLLARAAGGDGQAEAMLLTTLHAMAAGGVYDQIGGGFARYSTDARWQVPHFEKMLCDNVQLARVYAGAWRLSGEPRLRFVAEDILTYLLREMHPAAARAAFSSAQDADAEGVEGRFHVWALDEFHAVLGEDANAAAELYGVTAAGNWSEPDGASGRNVIERRDPEALRQRLAMSLADFDAWERSVRERLYAARCQRVWPITDDKVLADWNGMALRAFAEAGRWLGREDFVDAASALARFMLSTMRDDGLVRHAWRNGRLRGQAYLADQAQVGLGLVELHAATGETGWLLTARDLCAAMVEQFHDDAEGFADGLAGALPLVARAWHDGAVPSASAAACELLLRLAGPFDRADWHELARATLARHGALIDEAPMAVPALLHAQLLADQGTDLAVPSGAGAEALWAVAHAAFSPLTTPVGGAPDALPLLAGRRAGEAYLCRQGRCELPARSAQALQRQIDALVVRQPGGEATPEGQESDSE